MLKALLKKQFLELNTFYFVDRKSGKRRSRAGIIGYILLFLLLFLSVGVLFFGVAETLGSVLIPSGMSWVYFALMALFSIAFGTFGSIFNTYASLYQAKDNELLLSLPIPPSMILGVRMGGVYLMSLLYGSLVWIPTVLRHLFLTEGGVSAASLCGMILLLFVIALFVTVLTCALGFVVAKIAGKFRNKSFMTVLITLCAVGLYYVVYFRMSSILTSLTASPDKTANAIRSYLYPVYLLGQAADGDLVSLALTVLIALVLFGLCLFLLARSFIRLITASDGRIKKARKTGGTVVRSASSALYHKELKRFLTCPVYMLNCGLGILLLPVLSVLALINLEKVRTFISLFAEELPLIAKGVPVLAAAAVCVLLSMNCITTPSISLEGNRLWIAQSLPIEPMALLKAKLALHLSLNSLPTVLAAVILGIVIGADFFAVFLITVFSLLFMLLNGLGGLALDLHKPMLSWNSEAVPVKQNLSVLIVLFGSWLVSAAFSAGGLLLPQIPTHLYLGLCSLLCGIVSFLLYRHLKRNAGLLSHL